MAELGSHQLDACSIFLGKKHPLAVTGIGGTFFYTDGREVDDHVFVDLRVPRHRPARTTTSSSPTRRSTPTRSRTTARWSWARAGR